MKNKTKVPNPSKWAEYQCDDLEKLQELLLQSSLEPVFVAIDFEGLDTVMKDFPSDKKTQVGLSILDTIDLPTISIPTFNYIVGPMGYIARQCKKFIFGTAKSIKGGSKRMLRKINTHIPNSRNIVLVFHSAEGDLLVLQKLGFIFADRIIAIFDTSKVAKKLKLSQNTPSLEKLCHMLGCPTANLHNAGNDSHFTLRALILLATKSWENRIQPWSANTARSLKLKALASKALLVENESSSEEPLEELPKKLLNRLSKEAAEALRLTRASKKRKLEVSAPNQDEDGEDVLRQPASSKKLKSSASRVLVSINKAVKQKIFEVQAVEEKKPKVDVVLQKRIDDQERLLRRLRRAEAKAVEELGGMMRRMVRETRSCTHKRQKQEEIEQLATEAEHKLESMRRHRRSISLDGDYTP
ncbi:hypothetical protein B0O99DRAFT_738519 [Bisporella sp. PMI_857]|nr:hypothetical protein B0O99DRAFT_738519 [Bisporella sp. PMI_857]